MSIEKRKSLLKDDDAFEGVVYKPTTVNGPLEPDWSETGSPVFLYLTAFVVNLLAFSCGISFGWSSPVIPKMLNLTESPLAEPISQTEISWVAGILCLGSAFGPLIAGFLADKIGRKNTLLVLSLPILASYLVLGCTSSTKVYIASRFVKGLGVGGTFAVLPMYLGEISEDRNRGTIGCIMGVFITLGLLYSFVIGPLLSIKTFCFACTTPLTIFIALFFLIAPESPVFLAMKGNKSAATLSLMKLRLKSAPAIQRELSEFSKAAENDENGSIKDLFATKGLRKALVVILGLLFFQQVAGINAVLAYMQVIFEAGGGFISPSDATIGIAVIQVIATIATSCIVEKLGRKLLLLVSIIGSGTTLITLGLFFFLQLNGTNVSKISFLPVASLVGYIITFNLGLGPLPWAIMGELFPSNVKSIASTLNTMFCFGVGFIITLLFPIVVALLGMALTFWFFALCCAAGTVFIIAVVPETKGKSLVEIQELLNR